MTTAQQLHTANVLVGGLWVGVMAVHMVADIVRSFLVEGTTRHAALLFVSAETKPFMVPLCVAAQVLYVADRLAAEGKGGYWWALFSAGIGLWIWLDHNRDCDTDDRWRNRWNRLRRRAGSVGRRPATVAVHR